LLRLRKQQQFTFGCWLLWGPSIPICRCENFLGKRLSLQYGFGDETNSVEIYGDTDHLSKSLQKLRGENQSTERVRAVNGCITGRIVNSKSVLIKHKSDVARTLQRSWKADVEGRILLEVSNSDWSAGRNVRESYYSAYLWAIFVVFRIDPNNKRYNDECFWIPANFEERKPAHECRDSEPDFRRSARPWLDLIPFFEHGNIASAETYAFAKGQLAEKVVAGLARFVYGDPLGVKAVEHPVTYPLRFVFACSFDYSGCGTELYFEPSGSKSDGEFPENSLPDLIDHQIAEYDRLHETNLRTFVSFNLYNKDEHPHSACYLPDDIGDYFADMSRP
jgi:hypothetical protein